MITYLVLKHLHCPGQGSLCVVRALTVLATQAGRTHAQGLAPSPGPPFSGGPRRRQEARLITGTPRGECLLQIQDIVRRRQLLTIFREGKDGQQDVDVAILQALLKGEGPARWGPRGEARTRVFGP